LEKLRGQIVGRLEVADVNNSSVSIAAGNPGNEEKEK